MREGIQRDVDLAVGLPGGGLGCGEHQLQAVGRDAMRGEPLPHQVLEGRLGEGPGVEHQRRARDLGEDPGPEGHHPVVDPLGAAEIAEGDVARLQRRQGSWPGHVHRRDIGQGDARQPHHGLGEQVIGAFRGQLIVGQEGVHGRQARGVAMAQQVGDLDGRGLPGEHQDAA